MAIAMSASEQQFEQERNQAEGQGKFFNWEKKQINLRLIIEINFENN